jgi:hypothetical protein
MKEGHVMTARETTAANFPAGRKPAASPAPGTPPSASRTSRLAGAAVLGVAALAAAGALAGGAGRAGAAVLTNCAPTPGTCSYPTAATTGVPAGTTLTQVPGQVTSGPGWTWNATTKTAVVTGNGTTLSGLSVSGTLQISASDVTVKNVKVTTGGNFGISLTHTAGVTIAHSTISGQNATTGRVAYAIDDVYGDSTGTTITASNISNFRTGVQISAGLWRASHFPDCGSFRILGWKGSVNCQEIQDVFSGVPR